MDWAAWNVGAAWWGAVVATIVLLWDVFKWRRTHTALIRLKVRRENNFNAQALIEGVGDPTMATLLAQADHSISGFQYESDNGSRKPVGRDFLVLEVVNHGGQSTTIKGLGAATYRTWLDYFLKRPDPANWVLAIWTHGPSDRVLHPGDRVEGAVSVKELLEKAKNKRCVRFAVETATSNGLITKKLNGWWKESQS